MPLRGQGGHDPVSGVEDHVGGCEGDLEWEGGIGEADDAEHEGYGADEGDDSVGGVAECVLAFFRVPVELPCDVLVAFDDQEGAVGVCDYDVVARDHSFLFPFHEGEVPTAAEADEGGEEGQQYCREQSEAVISTDGETQEGDGHGSP